MYALLLNGNFTNLCRYPSYWVPIRMLFEALIPKDPVTNQPRYRIVHHLLPSLRY